MFNLWSTTTPRSFSADRLSRQLCISCRLVSFLPRCLSLHFPLLTSWHTPVELIWRVAQLFGLSVTLLPFFYHQQTCWECTLPIVHVINAKVEQYWPQYVLLGFCSSDWTPAGLPATGHRWYLLSLPEMPHYVLVYTLISPKKYKCTLDITVTRSWQNCSYFSYIWVILWIFLIWKVDYDSIIES